MVPILFKCADQSSKISVMHIDGDDIYKKHKLYCLEACHILAAKVLGLPSSEWRISTLLCTDINNQQIFVRHTLVEIKANCSKYNLQLLRACKHCCYA